MKHSSTLSQIKANVCLCQRLREKHYWAQTMQKYPAGRCFLQFLLYVGVDKISNLTAEVIVCILIILVAESGRKQAVCNKNLMKLLYDGKT